MGNIFPLSPELVSEVLRAKFTSTVSSPDGMSKFCSAIEDVYRWPNFKTVNTASLSHSFFKRRTNQFRLLTTGKANLKCRAISTIHVLLESL